MGYPQGGSVFLGGGGDSLSSRPYAEQTQAAIDAEVAKLLRAAEDRAMSLLRDNRDKLDRLVDLLLERETVRTGPTMYAAAGGQGSYRRARGSTVAARRAAGGVRHPGPFQGALEGDAALPTLVNPGSSLNAVRPCSRRST